MASAFRLRVHGVLHMGGNPLLPTTLLPVNRRATCTSSSALKRQHSEQMNVIVPPPEAMGAVVRTASGVRPTTPASLHNLYTKDHDTRVYSGFCFSLRETYASRPAVLAAPHG